MNSESEQYRIFGTKLHSLANYHIGLESGWNDLFRVYHRETAEILAGCQDFRTLEEHTHRYLWKKQRHHLQQNTSSLVQKLTTFLTSQITVHHRELLHSDRDVEAVTGLLEGLVEEGFLVSKQEIIENIFKTVTGYSTSVDLTRNIHVLGIPTRNRRELLARCVQSYLENIHRFNRSCSLHIADDSDERDESEKSRREIYRISKHFGTDIIWADLSYRSSFADAIAGESGVPETITRFALIGDDRWEIRTGACRNALLLMSAGEPSVQVDDDTVCEVLASPWFSDDLALSTTTDCNHYEFYRSKEVAMTRVSPLEQDFLALHERMLGKPPSEIIQNTSALNIDRMEPRLLEKITIPDARIGVSYVGALGDAGLNRHSWRLFHLNEDSFASLVKDAGAYEELIRTRQQFRVPSQMTISDGPYYMPMNIGLDSRYILPPFTPVQRNQDGPFSQLLHLGFKGICRGYLPYAIVHDPQGRPDLDNLSDSLAVGRFRTPDILDSIMWSVLLSDWQFGTDSIENIQTVGHYFVVMSEAPLNYFKANVRAQYIRVTQLKMGFVQRSIEEHFDAPDYWQKDARQVLTNYQNLLQRVGLCVPSDIKGDETRRWAVLQELVGKFGQLLIHWPAIWEAAVKLNASGKLEKLKSYNA